MSQQQAQMQVQQASGQVLAAPAPAPQQQQAASDNPPHIPKGKKKKKSSQKYTMEQLRDWYSKIATVMYNGGFNTVKAEWDHIHKMYPAIPRSVYNIANKNRVKPLSKKGGKLATEERMLQPTGGSTKRTAAVSSGAKGPADLGVETLAPKAQAQKVQLTTTGGASNPVHPSRFRQGVIRKRVGLPSVMRDALYGSILTNPGKSMDEHIKVLFK